MAYSKAQMEASNRYRAKAYDQLNIQVPKGERERYKAQAAAHGLSLNAYIVSLLEADAASASDAEALAPEAEAPSASGACSASLERFSALTDSD